ncbi:hypothetical protein FOZ63_005340 [Perkinsus olseni]|uniref:Uncharacterized protein n=1 Tax=Perkinsus olseni TaxID=32597 RepID=A0A7J6SHY4_PEROL|nr:hypothetical protein FOZ63_005340 [Perkinsus olseni]
MYEERDSSTSAAVAQPKDSPSTRSTSQFFDCPPEVELKRFQFYFCTSDENPISAGSPTPVDLFPPTTTVGREPIIRQATADVDLTPYANGRGVVNYYLADKAREGRVHHVVVLCEPDKWEDAQYYDGGTKDPVYRFCIRLHEKHHKKNKNLLSSGSRYKCIPDPKDTGGGKPEKRDWLCVEKYPSVMLLPPHGPPLEPSCTSLSPLSRIPTCRSDGMSFIDARDDRYTDRNPPEWCHYNWYERRQTCWCLPGYYRDSPKDTYHKPRACPSDGPIFLMPQAYKPTYPTQAPPPPTLQPREGNFDSDVGDMLRNNALFAGLLVLSILVFAGTRSGPASPRARAD